MKKISRETAARLGLKRFFTGVPCRNGHICERLVNGKECVECHRLRQQTERAGAASIVHLADHVRRWRKVRASARRRKKLDA